MSCQLLSSPRVDIVICSRGQSERCSSCGNYTRTPRRCDFRLGGAKAGRTCDRLICERCAVRVGNSEDLCPPHARVKASSDGGFPSVRAVHAPTQPRARSPRGDGGDGGIGDGGEDGMVSPRLLATHSRRAEGSESASPRKGHQTSGNRESGSALTPAEAPEEPALATRASNAPARPECPEAPSDGTGLGAGRHREAAATAERRGLADGKSDGVVPAVYGTLDSRTVGPGAGDGALGRQSHAGPTDLKPGEVAEANVNAKNQDDVTARRDGRSFCLECDGSGFDPAMICGACRACSGRGEGG
jgi:hypothetical protein